jgi:hypothetical protein
MKIQFDATVKRIAHLLFTYLPAALLRFGGWSLHSDLFTRQFNSRKCCARRLPAEARTVLRYLKDWAVQYGFSVDQVPAELNRWATDVQARSPDSYDLSLAAFAKEN